MNVLSQIIPGIREARTPLAIGSIWSIAAWVGCSLAPKEVWQQEIFSTAADQISKVPPEALIGIAALLIYLVGVFLQSMGEAISRFSIPLIFAGVGIVITLVLASAIFRLAVVLLPTGVVTLLAVAALRHHRLRSGTYWATVEDTLSSAWSNLLVYVEEHWIRYRTARATSDSLFNELCAESLEDYYVSNPSFLEDRVNELTHSSLHQAALGASLTLEEAHAEGMQDEELPSRVKTLADLRLHLQDVEKYDESVRKALIKKLKRERQARAGLSQVLELNSYHDWLRRRLNRADHDLRSKAELYMEYDRIRAEGEFRKGISLPLGALAAILCYKWHLTFNASGPKILLWGLLASAIVVWLVVHAAGASQADKATRLLYAAVRDRTVAMTQETPFGEPIFVFQPLPNIKRTETVKSAASNRLRRLLRQPLQRIFPELAEGAVSPTKPSNGPPNS
ncbi:hypothetical protein OOJ91_02110 [Micromonospora lupini]|uniref:hypothetical protein n=1 Tax=Micromonospora lupini TaxID=285679 RepID=UPI00225BF7DD|nr:hypothetical protein [Micromonospora lupini]MCX5064663.1 hypothetical protein [Micromonospora lupini]